MLMVDLNNFAMYPTASIGLIASICRRAGEDVSVFSPLSVGVGGIAREQPVSAWSLVLEKVSFWTARTNLRTVRRVRSWIGRNLRSHLSRSHQTVLRAFVQTLDREAPRIVLISAYLLYKDLVESIAAVCADRGIPVLLGGPYFAQPSVNQAWVGMRGITALVAGELERDIPAIINTILRDEDPTVFPGVLTTNGNGSYRGTIARPLADLSGLPFPDFQDFPWDLYPQRIVPVVTGRGCGWGACAFCSDVTSTAGRSYRSRPPTEVLAEIQHQHEHLGANLFIFTDLKLNSNVDMWRTIIGGIQNAAPGARWIGAIHCGGKNDGLTLNELKAAANAGCVRLTTGLESGSQRMLNLMRKGTRLDRLSQYFHDASAAGISARTTMIAGYPGETTDDVIRSAAFVEDHTDVIERLKLCTFSLIVGTGIDRQRLETPTAVPLSDTSPNYSQALVDHHMPYTRQAGYGAAMARLIHAVHNVNRKPLRKQAKVFEGVM